MHTGLILLLLFEKFLIGRSLQGKCSAIFQKLGCYHGTLENVTNSQWLNLLENKTDEASLGESLFHNISCTCAEKAKQLEYDAFQLETRYLSAYSKNDSQCTAVGVADPTIIPDSSFTASSSYDGNFAPHFARLRSLERGWSPTSSDRDSKNSFLQIDFGAVHSICAVATQGEYGFPFNDWTKSYKLQFSLTGSTWAYYKENGTDKVFTGNTDATSVVERKLVMPVSARFMRFRPVEYEEHPTTRIEVYSRDGGSPCPQIGVADHSIIPDSSFTASSSYSSYYKPHFARLRGLKRGWTPLPGDRDSKNSFLQIDLRAVYSICAVATQGEHGNDFDEWTKSYKLQFSLNGSTWAYYKENGTDKVFTGNRYAQAIVKRSLAAPVSAKLIRFLPVDYHNYPTTRLEIYGIEVSKLQWRCSLLNSDQVSYKQTSPPVCISKRFQICTNSSLYCAGFSGSKFSYNIIKEITASQTPTATMLQSVTSTPGNLAISPEARQLSKNAIASISVACGIVLVVGVVCLFVLIRRRRNAHTESKSDSGDHEVTAMYHIPPVDPWELLEGELTVLDTIGKGAFGEVCKGTLRVGDSKAKNFIRSAVKGKTPQHEITVAVKKLRDYANDDEKQQFVEEIKMMKKLGQHKNIVNMIACRTKREPFLLVVEYLPKGDLLKYLRRIRTQVSGSYCDTRECSERETTDQEPGKSNKKSPGSQAFEGLDPEEDKPGGIPTNITHKECVDNKLQIKALPESGPSTDNHDAKAKEDDLKFLELKDFLSVSWQISCGLEYLAAKGYVHRDLAARNVLIGQNKVVKVADFGLSRLLYEGMYRTEHKRKLPIKWMPPESIFYQSFTTKSDVWAFGVLLWEMTTLGGIPYPGLSNKNLVKDLRRGYRMEKPETCSDEIYDIMTSCWSEHPEDRPSFTQIRTQLETMMEQDSPYWDLSTLEAEGSTYYNTVPVIGASSSSSDVDSD